MKLIHTADWHLGRILHGERLINEQAFVLDQILGIAKKEHVRIICISGDVYDRSVPPNDAIELLDEFLCRAVLDLNIAVIMISGNHDNASRLTFGNKLLNSRNVHLIGNLHDVKPIFFSDDEIDISVCPIPYFEPILARDFAQKKGIHEDQLHSITSHESAMQFVLNVLPQSEPHVRRVLLAHAFVAGCSAFESERPLSVGGSDRIGSSCFAGFDYVGLGHLHKCQTAADNRIHYSGSPLKYSFSEAQHEKSINLVEFHKHGGCNIQQIPLTPKQDVRIIEGFFEDLLHKPQGNTNDFLKIVILDQTPLSDPIGKLKQIYPNVLLIDRSAFFRNGPVVQIEREKLKHNELELFRIFFKEIMKQDISENQEKIVVQSVSQARKLEQDSAE